MCNITNETDLQEAVIYKVVYRKDELPGRPSEFVSPYALLPFEIGKVSERSMDEVNTCVSWSDHVVGRITGFTELSSARRLMIACINPHPRHGSAKALLRVKVSRTPELPILEGDGKNLADEFADDRILAAPVVLEIEDITWWDA